MPACQGEEVIDLRPYTAADVHVVRTQVFGPGLGEFQWFGFTPPRLLQEFENTGLLTPEGGRLVVEDDGELVGSVQWFRRDWGPPTTSWCWEIGIALLPSARGRGVGTQAQVLLRDYLLDHTRAERIQACTDLHNLAEQRALDKAGFTREGLLRSAQWRSGRWHDQYLYSYVRSDRG